jgi:LOB domain-containing protein 16
MAGAVPGAGACKFLRRRCVPECVFAPYFSTDQGAARFAAIHKVFGASNASKLLSHLPVADRCEAVVTITYEAQARLRDPVYGCVAQIFALQQQVAFSLPFVCLSLSLSRLLPCIIYHAIDFS